MTFVAAITAFADRVLSARAFELIVAPALADFEFDATSHAEPGWADYGAVFAAVAGALWDDVIRGGHLVTFAGLSLIPLSYYAIWFLLWLEQGVDRLSRQAVAGVALAILVLSMTPVLACFWPSPVGRRTPTEPQ